MKVDLVIIGGGSAAFGAATKANELGVSTVLVNDGLPLGGTCVNVGCVPSKFLLELSTDVWRSSHPRFQSIPESPVNFSLSSISDETQELIERNRRSKYADILEGFKSVQLVEARAKFEGPGKIRAGNELIEAKNVTVCTGSSNKIPPIEGLASMSPDDVLDNAKVFGLRSLPKSIIILGGGPTGLEIAQSFAHLGVRVSLIEAKDRLFSISEPVISEAILKNLRKLGIQVFLRAKADQVTKDQNDLVLSIDIGGEKKSLRSEKLFVATGVKGNTDDLNLAAIGLETNNNGFIEVDDRMRTKVPTVFAAGDVAGPPWLETLAAREGAIAVEAAFNGGNMKINYDAIPSAVFIEPQVATVGLTEEQLMSRISKCECRTVDLKFVPKADITNQTEGVAKMVIDPESKKLMGFHVVAPHAAEIIHAPTMAINLGATLKDITDMVHVFPTFSEVVKITAQSFHRDITRMSCCVE